MQLWSEDKLFQRTALMLGEKKMQALAQKKGIIFGIGGVGSWCAESLIRSGIRKLCLVDFDVVCESNVNRQAHASVNSLNQTKVIAMKNRLLEINPLAEIQTMHEVFSEQTKEKFQLNTYDFIVDAIDSIESKLLLIRMATETEALFVSSMGAALKMDPTRIKVTEFWKVHGCRLAYILRKRIRKGQLPAKPFWCVYSDELIPNEGDTSNKETDAAATHGIKKAVINGTVAHITAIFGFTLAGLIIQSFYQDYSE